MRIVADENIPYVREAFADLGEVTTCAGRSIDADTVREADVLLVRSVTQVNESLLAGSRVSYVGTATSGLEHIDLEYLSQNDIGFGHAQGANANSVAEYVLAALLEAVLARNLPLDRITCGIVGYGHVGSRVFQLLSALGVDCRVYDPPLAEASGDDFYCTWETIQDCDAITFHTPLTMDGPYPTHQMVEDTFLSTIRPDTVLINAARGGIMDTGALIRAKAQNPDLFYVFDVWENEPDIDLDLLELTNIATPHVAGYSWDGKVSGTRQIYEGVCGHFGLTAAWVQPVDPPRSVSFEIRDLPDHGVEALHALVRHVYSILEDDELLRTQMEPHSGSHGAAFDRLRKNYWMRREFGAYRVDAGTIGAEICVLCEALGFTLVNGV